MSESENNAAGLAALSICESILLSLIEERIIDRDRILEYLEDALEMHTAAMEALPGQEAHKKAARLIEQISISLNAIAENDESMPQRLVLRLAGSGRSRR